MRRQTSNSPPAPFRFPTFLDRQRRPGLLRYLSNEGNQQLGGIFADNDLIDIQEQESDKSSFLSSDEEDDDCEDNDSDGQYFDSDWSEAETLMHPDLENDTQPSSFIAT